MPGGVGGAAPRGAPLSPSVAKGRHSGIGDLMQKIQTAAPKDRRASYLDCNRLGGLLIAPPKETKASEASAEEGDCSRFGDGKLHRVR